MAYNRVNRNGHNKFGRTSSFCRRRGHRCFLQARARRPIPRIDRANTVPWKSRLVIICLGHEATGHDTTLAELGLGRKEVIGNGQRVWRCHHLHVRALLSYQ